MVKRIVDMCFIPFLIENPLLQSHQPRKRDPSKTLIAFHCGVVLDTQLCFRNNP